jgi:hypothetical protein
LCEGFRVRYLIHRFRKEIQGKELKKGYGTMLFRNFLIDSC